KKQVQLDLHRTLTTNQHFSSPSSPALQQLRRILLAFSWHNPAIGYCQGLNRLAALALLVLQSEEDAFWTTTPRIWWPLRSADTLTCLPDHNIDVSLVTFNWFLVVFVESLPSDILMPLWDAFLYEDLFHALVSCLIESNMMLIL
uniref:Rab-GAP TBC domain-containing protein n=1 Tax=Maylandia zebra TaxID=106582 RepID=A0A3P9B419_9CICH